MATHAKRITVPLSVEEFEELLKSAQSAYRHPREQARYLLRLVLLDKTVRENSKAASVMNVSEADITGDFASIIQ